jgi:hypothetical protein
MHWIGSRCSYSLELGSSVRFNLPNRNTVPDNQYLAFAVRQRLLGT